MLAASPPLSIFMAWSISWPRPPAPNETHHHRLDTAIYRVGSSSAACGSIGTAPRAAGMTQGVARAASTDSRISGHRPRPACRRGEAERQYAGGWPEAEDAHNRAGQTSSGMPRRMVSRLRVSGSRAGLDHGRRRWPDKPGARRAGRRAACRRSRLPRVSSVALARKPRNSAPVSGGERRQAAR